MPAAILRFISNNLDLLKTKPAKVQTLSEIAIHI